MTTTLTDSEGVPGRRSWFGPLAILFSGAFTGLVTVIAGMAIENALDGRVRDRSIWGILLMSMSVPSWLVLILVIRRRERFSVPDRSRRWLNFAKLPGIFVVVWLLVFIAYGNPTGFTSTPILPHTPQLTIQFMDRLLPSCTTHGEFHSTEGGWGESPPDGKLQGKNSFRHHAHSEGIEPKSITIAGNVLKTDHGRGEAHLDLVLKQKTRVRIGGLEDMHITIDGQPSNANFELDAGTYKLVILGTR